MEAKPGSRYLGLISGTSMDAIDACLVDFEGGRFQVIAARSYPYDSALKARLTDLIDRPDRVSLDEIGRLDVEIGRAFAASASALLAEHGLEAARVAAVGSHGQTIRHQPSGSAPFSWQIGDPNVIAEAIGLPVVADFRRRDMAAGGQGAPLVPGFHDHVFRSKSEDRVIANVGGISNITVLRGGMPVLGFDTGPGNRLLDAWCHRHTGREFDAGGQWAATGSVNQGLLSSLLTEPYLALAAPKSTGRELFNLDWLDRQLTTALPGADVQATLLEYSAQTLADAIQSHAPNAAVYVCGGGAHNAQFLLRLDARLLGTRVATTASLGLDPDFVEAAAFAWFAKQTLASQPSNVPSVTGATGLRVLGAIYAAAPK